MAKSRLCSISGCGKPHYGKGFCQTHYMRLRNHGDPLGGATSKGELLRWIHEEAMHHSGEECLTWPYGKSTNGYGRVNIDGKRANASRYVCEQIPRSRWNAGEMRNRLTMAKEFGECVSFSEATTLFKSMFYVSDASEGLAREVLGDDYVDRIYAIENQNAAMKIKRPYTGIRFIV